MKSAPSDDHGRRDSGQHASARSSQDTFLQAIALSVAKTPEDRVFARWYNRKGQVESTRTFHGVWGASGEIAHLLRVEWGLTKGDRVVLAFNFGLRFFAVFLGCLRAGIIAVPVYPPNPATLKKSLQKLQLIVEGCTPKMILVCPLVNKLRLAWKLRVVATGKSGWPNLPYHCPDVKEETIPTSGLAYTAVEWKSRGSKSTDARTKRPSFQMQRPSFDDPTIKPEDVAFLQFTSGSTSDPKGVMLTYGNLTHNIEAIINSSNAQIVERGGVPGGNRTWFSWLPAFHDMGLIHGTLVPFLAGWTAAYCSPITFMRRPLMWLELMSKEKSQMTAAPDFAFRLCVRKWKEMSPESRTALHLDLRPIMFMQNAAEPVRASTVRDFAATFAAVGLPAYASNAAYGLAEHTVGCASFSPNLGGRESLSDISDERLQASGDVHASANSHIGIKVIDPETCREVPVGETGEMWISSKSVAAGYWGKPELTQETFRARIKCDTAADGSPAPPLVDSDFLRTGDLCRVDTEGLLYVEGRLKDLVIVAGRNVYPQDIEFVAQDASSLVRPGCIAVFSETELGGGVEIVMEVRTVSKKKTKDVMEAMEAVRRSVISESGLTPSRVVAIKEGTIPKTTSGKIQRRKTRTMLHGGGLDVVQEIRLDPTETTAFAAVQDQTTDDITGVATNSDTETLPNDTERPPKAELCAQDVIDIVEAATGVEGIGESDDLLDLGIDSLVSVGISKNLSEASGCDLPQELVFTHPTAALIAEFISSTVKKSQATLRSSFRRDPNKGNAAGDSLTPARTSSLDCAGGSRLRDLGGEWTTGPMQGWVFRLTQTILLALVLLQIFVALQPARHYWRYIHGLSSTTSFGGYPKQPWIYVDLPVRALGLLGALSPIIWFACFTAIVIVTKILLGAHPQERVPLGTRAYLSWWYMNAMLNVWECVGGTWLLDTKMIIFIYRCMGAKIAWTASISVFIRDFDSVDVREGAKVGGNLYVRRFEASYMDVAPIMIGKGADIGTGSVVYGGASVGDHCFVEPLTVIPPLSKLAPHSTWEGHPAKETKKGDPAQDGVMLDVPGPCAAIPCLIEFMKQIAILCTLVATTAMIYIPTILYESTGVSENFRYALLVEIVILVAGVPSQLALYTVLLKWVLAGRVTGGSYQPTVFQTWRRWYLGRLSALVFAYFNVFNQCPRYEWWAAALGMKVGRGSVILLEGYNPEDAHLIEIGSGAHAGYPILSVDRPTGRGTEREKKAIAIGSKVLLGFGAHLGAGSTVGNGAMLGGYSVLRPGEHLTDGSVTMCDQQSAFQPCGTTPTSPARRDGHNDAGEAVKENLIDAACTLGACSLITLALVASFEATTFAASSWSKGDGFDTRVVVLSTVALVVWALASAVLLAVFKRVFVGDFRRKPAEGQRKEISAQIGPRTTDIEKGQRRKPNKLTASQVMRWRWMQRFLYFSLFEPYIVNTVLRGTWLLNVWLRLMGADVSMGALILGKVSDHGMVKVCRGSVVAGVLYGHCVSFVDGVWSMEMVPACVGEGAVVHAHTGTFCTDMRGGSTLTAASATLSGQVLEAGQVFGGRPPRQLAGSWVP
ncbi:unnamed protein product [Ectocarpus sp. 6 AP-2014]